MSTSTVPPSDARDDNPGSTSERPAWMKSRRDNVAVANEGSSGEVPVPVTFDDAEPVEASELAAFDFAPPTPRVKQKPKPSPLKIPDDDRKRDRSKEDWWTAWITRQGLIGFAVSLLLHTTVLISLAFIVMSHVSDGNGGLSLFGVAGGDSDQMGNDILIDTTLGDSESGESAPLVIGSVTDVLEGIGPGPSGDVSEAMRTGKGGHGHGEGDSGDGDGMGVGRMRIPGHAQTKGSFSAWPDPRDPKPGEDYFVVIQIKLPEKIKKYKGSDLSGMVIGTDKYKQEIRYPSNQTFPIEGGSVQFRIRVPGAARLVRDTVRVESKMLHEKQTFEIEF